MECSKFMRYKIKLISTGETGHFYTTTKSKNSLNTKKISLKKYDPVIRKHVLYKESKLK